MKNKSNIQRWPPEGHILQPDHILQTPYTPVHREYFNEGDEFLDDAIRTVDQGFGQIDGTLEVHNIRSGLSK